MNNRYFGNIHDFFKYGLLRLLTERGGLSLGVCWMLTGAVIADARRKGSDYKYLLDPATRAEYEKYDEKVFRFLREKIGGTVVDLQEGNLLPRTAFFDRLMPKVDSEGRARYFNEMLDKFAVTDLIFLDPDSGVYLGESPPARRKERYIMPDEIEKCYRHGDGHSILFYQDYRPDNSDTERDNSYAIRRALCEFSHDDAVYRFEGVIPLLGQSASAVGGTRARFFLLPHRRHAEQIEGFVKWFETETDWSRGGMFPVARLRSRVGVFIDDESFNSLPRIARAYHWIGNQVIGDIAYKAAFGKNTHKNKNFYEAKNFLRGSVAKGKNKADIALSNIVIEQIKRDALEVVCVLGADKDYRFLANYVKSQGVRYYGFAGDKDKVNKDYLKECTRFFRVGDEVREARE